MENSNAFSPFYAKAYRSLFMIGLWLIILTPALAFSETPGDDTAGKGPTEIHVTSDYLISDRNARYAEFQGNVVATQKGSVLTGDRLKITFIEPQKNNTGKTAEENDSPAGSIESIVATGNVKMVMEDKTAWAEKAVFNRVDDTIILTGGPPRVVTGKSSLTGNKIVIKRATGQVTAFRGENQPVDAYFNEEDMKQVQNPDQ